MYLKHLFIQTVVYHYCKNFIIYDSNKYFVHLLYHPKRTPVTLPQQRYPSNLTPNSINVWVSKQRTHITRNFQSTVKMSSTSDQASDNVKHTEEKRYTEKEYRTIQEEFPKLMRNTPPVCRNIRSYELIRRRIASDTRKAFYECQICGKITKEYGNLNKHCKIHTGQKPYQCTFCGKGFSNTDVYNAHWTTHSKALKKLRRARSTQNKKTSIE